jgi:hypothetical protein
LGRIARVRDKGRVLVLIRVRVEKRDEKTVAMLLMGGREV